MIYLCLPINTCDFHRYSIFITRVTYGNLTSIWKTNGFLFRNHLQLMGFHPSMLVYQSVSCRNNITCSPYHAVSAINKFQQRSQLGVSQKAGISLNEPPPNIPHELLRFKSTSRVRVIEAKLTFPWLWLAMNPKLPGLGPDERPIKPAISGFTSSLHLELEILELQLLRLPPSRIGLADWFPSQ